MGRIGGFVAEMASRIAQDDSLPWDFFRGKTILVTGSTGLIGSQFTRVLLAANAKRNLSMRFVLPVRSTDKAKRLFGESDNVFICEWELGKSMCGCPRSDLYVHAACGTSSSDFLKKPASTIEQIVNGSKAVLDAAKRDSAEKIVFLSTMEVYGEVNGNASESDLGKLDPMVVRNSYPEAKRLVECMCASYSVEFGLPSLVLRLAQTFGEGVNPQDKRVFAEFGRFAVSGNDIVLLSEGLKSNAYLSVDDAVRAIIIALVFGEQGEAYNVANEQTYCSILEMANFVLKNFGSESAVVRREFDPERAATFRNASNLQLDTSKLRAIGWVPKDGLFEMYSAMIKCWSAGNLQESENNACFLN